MNRSRNQFLRNAFLAGGIALGGAGLFFATGAPDVFTGPGMNPAPAYPVRNVVEEYNGPDNAAALQARVVEESQTRFTLVVYHAPWCPYCRKLTEQMTEASAYTDIPYHVIKVDVERFPALAASAKQMDGVPETFVYAGGRQVDHFGGAAADTRMVVDFLQSLEKAHPRAAAVKQYISPHTPFPKSQ